MFKRILIATDGSELAQDAVQIGLGLAKALKASVTVVTVTQPWAEQMPGEEAITGPGEDYAKVLEAEAHAILAPVAETAAQVQVECVCRHETDQSPADGILSAAKSVDCDLIVMSTHGRTVLQRLFIGSHAQKVLAYSHVPVLICRRDPRIDLRIISEEAASKKLTS